MRNIPDCIVYSKSSLPVIDPEHRLPDDVKEFYEWCGGATLFDHSEYAMDIVSPQEFVLANPVLFVGGFEKPTVADKRNQENMSWSWYIVGKGNSGEYLTIDLDETRLGRCYYSFWDRHAMKGYSPIIALSFTDLLQRLIENKGQRWYWEQAEFKSFGDAYD